MRSKLLFMWIVCTMCTLSKAQTSELEYHSFAKEGKMWQTQIGGIKENDYVYRVKGDTIIDGEKWMRVYSYVGFDVFNIRYFAAIRDVGKKVYAIAKGSNTPRLLYNFDLKVGGVVKCGVEGSNFGCLLDTGEKPDTLLGFPLAYTLKVESIDTIKYSYNGKEYRRFTFKLLDPFNYLVEGVDDIVWIEGIGSAAGVFSPWMSLPKKGSFLQNCIEDGKLVFGEGLYYEEEYPSVVGSPRETKKKVSAIYDLDGRQLSEAPHKGVYIQDGKKVALK